MGLYFSFPSGWWGLFIIIIVIYLFCWKRRNNKRDDEMAAQAKVGLVVLVVAMLFEFIGVSLGLWSYFPSNWPIILPISYFLIGITIYQVVKLFDEN